MRAIVVTELFSPTRGGTAVWFDQVYGRPEAAGCEVVTSKVAACEAFDRSYPRAVHRIPWRRHRWLRPESAAIYAGLLRRIVPLAWTGRFEAIHAGRVLPEGFVSILAKWLSHLPVVIYAHGEEITGWREPAKQAFMRWTYRRADAVIANSEKTRELLVDLGVDPARIAVQRPGVDTERFSPEVSGQAVRSHLGIDGAPLILSVGRLQPRKGFDRVIEALPEIARLVPTVQYAIVGSGQDEGRLRQLAFVHHVADRVHFVGQVSDEVLPEWYAASDVFAMPNRDTEGDTEGFGMVYLEAAASGKSALAGCDGGTGSAVVDGVTGLRVDGHSAQTVAGGLLRLLLDRGLSETMGQQGRARVCRELTWQVVARKTVELHEAVWARPHRTGPAQRRPVGVSLAR